MNVVLPDHSFDNDRTALMVRDSTLLKQWMLLALYLFFPTPLIAGLEKAGEPWRWVQFTTEVGLPSNRVFDVVETSSGTIWAITQSGLAAYDGYCWYPMDESDGLPESRIHTVVEYSRDEVLVLAGSRLFRGGMHGFKELVLTHNGRQKTVARLDGLVGTQFLAVCDSELYEISGESLHPFLFASTVFAKNILNVIVTKHGGLWINSTRGLYRDNGKGPVLVLPAFRTSLAVGPLAVGKDGRAIVYVSSPVDMKGVWEVDPGVSPRRLFDQTPGVVYSIDINPDGEAVIVFETGRVAIRRGTIWRDMLDRPAQMKDILFLRFRNNGDSWVGTESALFLFQSSSSRWTYWVGDKMDERMSTNEILMTRDSTIWLGRGIGIEQRGKDGSVSVIERIHGIPIPSVTGLAQDGDGNVWISSGGGFEGVFRWDGSHWKHFGLNEGLASRYVHRISVDRRGRPWFLGLLGYEAQSNGGSNGTGAFVLDSGTFAQWGQQEGLPAGRVYAFAEGHAGEYWFGTSMGLSCWKEGRWTHWTTAQGLKQNRVFSLAVDPANRVWFGDQSNGLGTVHHDSVRYYTTFDGLVSDAVWEVKVDARGRIWVATRGGLSCYDNGEWMSFGPGSGLNNARLWPVLPTDDKVYVGTSGGGTAILSLRDENVHSAIAIPAAPIVETGSVLLRWSAYSYFGEIGHRDIETRYRVDNQPFSEWSRKREAIVSNVAHGTHTFQVQAKGLFGVRDSSGKTVSFTIPPPFYQQPVFIIPVGALSLCLVVLGLVFTVRKKRLDGALRASEARYRSVIEDQAEFIVRFLPDGTRTFVNDAYCKHFGKSSAELVGTNFFHSILDTDSERVFAKLAQLTPHNPVATDEHRSVASGGDVRWHQWTDRAVFDEDWCVAEFQAVGRDITERKRMEEALRVSEEKFRSIIETTSEWIWEIDNTGKHTYSNPAVESILGYPPSEIVGRSSFDLLHEEDLASIQAKLPELIASKQGWKNWIIRWRHRDGSYRHLESNAEPFVDASGQLKGYRGADRDVTDRKKADERIRASLREKETLIKEIHHRVKNNLQVVSSLLNLQSRYIKDEHSLSLFHESQNRVKSMALIHEKLYQSDDFANIDFGYYVKNLTAYLYRSYVIDPGVITLTVDIDNVKLNLDRAIPCGLIINELVSNCLKYAFPEGHAGHIHVAFHGGNNATYTLTVRDNGVGLPESFNIRTADSLGLQLVSSLADQLEATIDLKRGGGTEYSVSFTTDRTR